MDLKIMYFDIIFSLALIHGVRGMTTQLPDKFEFSTKNSNEIQYQETTIGEIAFNNNEIITSTQPTTPNSHVTTMNIGLVRSSNGNKDFYVVSNGLPCSRLSFSEVLLITYGTATRLNELKIEVSKNCLVSGVCVRNHTVVNLQWDEGLFELSFYFVRMINKWALEEIRVKINLSSAIFQDIEDISTYTFVSELNTRDINSPLGMSYECKMKKIHMKPNVSHAAVESVALGLRKLRIQPFELETDGSFGKAKQCTTETEDGFVRRTDIANGVAIFMSALFVLVVIGYVIYKRNQKMPYVSMQ